MRWWVAPVVVVIMVVGGGYWAWSGVQARLTLPKRLLNQYMPVKINAEAAMIINYDSSFLPAIDGGSESRLWRIALAGKDNQRVAAFCEKRPMWSPPSVNDGAADHLLNHSNYLGVRFSPCELVVERKLDHRYQTFITFDGRYLTLERFASWP